MQRDLKNISIIKRSKIISPAYSSIYVIPCVVDGLEAIIKSHKFKWGYRNEKAAYFKLKNESFLPKLLYFDDKHLILCMTDVGDSVYNIKNINLKDYEKELVNIIDKMLSTYKLFHNDLRPKNICIDKNNNIKLIDFDRTCHKPIENKYIFRTNKWNFPSYYF